MPNFAQQYPLLLFLPLFIFAALALIVAFMHAVIRLEAKFKASRLGARQQPPAIIPALPAASHMRPPKLRIVSTRP